MPIFPTGYPNGTPATDDRLLFSDTSDSNATKDCTISDLPISTATQTALDSKVDKTTTVNGKALSSNVTLTTDDVSEGSTNKYDQIVSLLAGAGIQVTGTYPNFTVTNSSPDQVVALTAGTNITITGTYPNFTINSGGGGGGQVDSVVGGTNISVDSTDPTAPVVSLSLGADDNFVTDVEKTNIGYLDSAAYQPTSAFAPALGTDDNYVTGAEKVVIGNTSGTNSGDNATNTQYSGLATSKQDTLVNQTNIKSINGQSLLGAGDIEITSGGLTYSAINSSQAITNGNYYGVTCTGDIILTLADGTSSGQNLSIKKLDNTAYTITITGNIEGETSIIIDTQYESLDLFWNGTYYLIK